MAAKLTRLTHKIAIQLHLVAESCNICSSRSRRPVRKLLDILTYKVQNNNVTSIWHCALRVVLSILSRNGRGNRTRGKKVTKTL